MIAMHLRSVAILAQITMSHAAKLRKLDDFRRSVPDVSASALEAILKHAKEDMPELDGRHSIRQGRDIQVNEVTPYGALMETLQIETTDGKMEDLKVINPFAQLWTASKKCEGFAKLIADRLVVKPSTYEDPWNLVIYSDEVVPGNQLSFHNLRKCWILYWSFKEFGPEILCKEDAWFCISSERSDRVKQFTGGVAQLFKVILVFLFAVGGHSLKTAGVALDLFHGGTARVWAKLDMILQDGGAHKQVFCVKGESGHKFCMICRTLYSILSNIWDEDAGTDCLTCNLHLFKEMDFAKDSDVRGTVNRLAWIAANTPGELKLREQACGFNHNKMNMLLEPSLDNIVNPISNMAHDWMHTFVVHGVWNTVIWLLLTALGADAVKSIHDYILLWSLPRRVGSNKADQLADAFTPGRWKSSSRAKHFKCQASDAMSMYSIIGCFICAVYMAAGVCVNECQAYMRLCDVLDLLVASTHGCVTPKQLHDAVDEFLQACLLAGWQIYMHPKFHWCIHLAVQLKKFGLLLSCWVHERKHKMVKRYTDRMRNTRSYETSVLAEITCQHLHDIALKSTFDLSIGLLEPIAQCKPAVVTFLSQALRIPDNEFSTTSKKARVSKFEVVHVGDVVVFQDTNKLSIGKVTNFVTVDDVPIAVIAWWKFQSKNTKAGTVEVQARDAKLRFRPIQDIRASCTYRIKATGCAQVIVSCMYRDGVL